MTETKNWTNKYWASQITSLQLRFLIYKGEISQCKYTKESDHEALTVEKCLPKMPQMVIIVIKMLAQN